MRRRDKVHLVGLHRKAAQSLGVLRSYCRISVGWPGFDFGETDPWMEFVEVSDVPYYL